MTSRLPRRAAAASSLLVAALLAGCGNDDSTASGTCDYPDAGAAAKEVDKPPASPDQDGPLDAVLRLGQGDLTMTLTPDEAPCTVNSFVSLVEQGWYDSTECHRLTTEGIFVLQCGDPTATGTGGPGYTIPDEVDGSETYPAGTVAMARTSAPDSGGSQFFLVYEESQLSADYTVFGSFGDDGVELLRQIARGGTADGTTSGPPATPAEIETITLERE
ncbi:peptidylprolyl isomerase [Nocardioides sp. Y6]|uniref:Peptidylprolyl isomerase n=1 Tax=Nocardioides malaquae TaxID=2773426 RepID=A0ABR9RVV8_9ACTN|nr:peptidylprolyl isomerase [Nocardioides malaquae]MBE7325701.1 peptidylprolyl isomerase [Nocardioides malaquae]